jgi:hypothetical protein
MVAVVQERDRSLLILTLRAAAAAAALKMATRWTRCLAVAYLAGVRAFVAPYAQSCCVRSNSALACTTAKAETPTDTLFEMPRQTDEMVAQAAGKDVYAKYELIINVFALLQQLISSLRD